MEPNRIGHLLRNHLSIPLLWTLLFIISFRVLARFPSGIFEVLFILTVLITGTVALKSIVSDWINQKANYYQLYLFLSMLLPFMVANQARIEFGQPYYLGLLAQRPHYIVFTGYFVFISLRKGWISLENLEKRLMTSLFIILLIMMFFSVFVDPVRFSETEFVEFNLNKGWKYGFPSDMVAVVILYSSIKLLAFNRTRYLAFLLMGIMYFLFYIQDRSQILAISLTIGLFFLFNVSLNRKIVFLNFGLVLAGITIGILQLFKPELIDHYITLFSNASTIATGESTSEYSTSVRIKESAIAVAGIQKNPLLGNGFLSAQFKGGFSGLYGYFYAADVGILGNLFVYGIIGTLFIYVPFILTFLWRKHLNRHDSVLLKTCQYGLVFIFFDMITAASNIKYPGLPVVLFAVIYYFRYYVPMAEDESFA